MVIIIENKEAVLKKGASFDYISENRFFTGADGYTLSITFPLRGCPQNLEIFGCINRKDHDLDKLLLDCEIHDRGFHAYGGSEHAHRWREGAEAKAQGKEGEG